MLKTTVAGTYTADLAPIVIDDVRVIGLRRGPFPKAIDALANRSIDVCSLIGAEFTLDEAETAFGARREGGKQGLDPRQLYALSELKAAGMDWTALLVAEDENRALARY